MNISPNYTIVLPVYYNAESLWPAYRKLKQVIHDVSAKWSGSLLYVDDGSGDESFQVLQQIQQQQEIPVTIIKLSRNFGQVMAIRAGLAYTATDVAIVMSADGQDPVTLIPELLAKHFEENNEVVICARQNREEGAWRTWTSKIFYTVMNKLSFPEMPLGGFDCFLLGKQAKQSILAEQEQQPFLQGQILRLGFKRAIIPYTRLHREFGRSRWILSKKIGYFLDGLLNYSFFPIRAVSYLGMLLAFVGLFYAIVVLFAKLLVGNPVQGWTPLMIVILVLGGAQMLTLGIFGEYLWRIFVQVQRRSAYIVEQCIPPKT